MTAGAVAAVTSTGALMALTALTAARAAGQQAGVAGGGAASLNAGPKLTVITWGGRPAIQVRSQLVEALARRHAALRAVDPYLR